MLTQVDDLERRIVEFWPAAQDVTHSTYPTYADGVKDFADFADKLRSAAAADWGEVLLHDTGAALVLIEAEDDEYVSLRLWALGNQNAALNDALLYLRQHYPGKTLWLGFAPANAEMLAFAQENGFSLLDDTVNWNMPLACWQLCPECEPVQPVTRENYAVFRSLWMDSGMYWNADRIEAALDRWMLFVTVDGRGAVACMDEGVMLEIFGFQYRDGCDEAAFRALMTACLNEGKAQGAEYLTYFSDRKEAAVMQSLGFRRISDYLCYEKKL